MAMQQRAARKTAQARPGTAAAGVPDTVFAELHFVPGHWHGAVPEAEVLELRFPPGAWSSIEQAAMEWTYVARSRQRWVGSGPSLDEHGARAARLLDSYGIGNAALQRLARAHLVEVHMAAADDNDGGWSLRVLPWEYLLAAATASLRHGEPIVVVRSMDLQRTRKRAAAAIARRPAPQAMRVLYVESTPGEAAAARSWRGQRELVALYLTGDAAGHGMRTLYAPTPEALAEAIAGFKPHVVHLSGFDAHEARLRAALAGQALGEPPSVAAEGDLHAMHDGFVLACADGTAHPVPATQLAWALTGQTAPREPGRWFPWLVCLQLENSSARLAARAVQFGVQAAVGIQDSIDACVAERFFGSFYAGIRRGLPLARAFQTAWLAARQRPGNLTGTGIVLWTEQRIPQLSQRAQAAQGAQPVLCRHDMDPVALSERIRISVLPCREVNYSQLHNGGSLFDEFALRPHPDHIFKSVQIRVTLSAGAEDAQYATVIDLAGTPVDLRHDIRVALSAALIRGVHESIGTTVAVDIRWGAHVLHHDTYPVRLLPSDQWRDALQGRSWLPSFVFPRDPAVVALVARAQAFLRVLDDDPQAGFTGYARLTGPLAEPEADCLAVDTQVRALWATVQHEWAPGYINPPPTYSLELDSQRLRTPSTLVRERQGTCIDLALLFAAALELVDIWPVVFLTHNHALVGYWRSHAYHEEFRTASREPQRLSSFVDAGAEHTSVGGSQRFAWAVGRTMHREIQMEIGCGRLVPVETTWLTRAEGFRRAVEEGRRRLVHSAQFDFLIDIAIARRSNVTPLPIAGAAPAWADARPRRDT